MPTKTTRTATDLDQIRAQLARLTMPIGSRVPGTGAALLGLLDLGITLPDPIVTALDRHERGRLNLAAISTAGVPSFGVEDLLADNYLERLDHNISARMFADKRPYGAAGRAAEQLALSVAGALAANVGPLLDALDAIHTARAAEIENAADPEQLPAEQRTRVALRRLIHNTHRHLLNAAGGRESNDPDLYFHLYWAWSRESWANLIAITGPNYSTNRDVYETARRAGGTPRLARQHSEPAERHAAIKAGRQLHDNAADIERQARTARTAQQDWASASER